MIMIPIRFEDFLKVIDQLSDEQKLIVQQRLDELKGSDSIQPRTPNLHPGSIQMSDDFDEPLSDES